MTNLVLSASSKIPRLYERMQTAIAAYHKQIKDDVAMRQFLEIKMRAWRRLGEIFRAFVTPDCETFAACVRKVRATIHDRALDEMSDIHIKQAIDVAQLPSDFFEANIGGDSALSGLLSAFERLQDERWKASPEGQKEAKRIAEITAEARAEDAKAEAKRQAKALEEHERAKEKLRLLDALEGAHFDAVRANRKLEVRELQDARYSEDPKAVGISLERHDREPMHTTVFLLRESVHEVLRKAAFDNRMTRHAVLREGLAMWFIANGYDAPMSEIDLCRIAAEKKRA